MMQAGPTLRASYCGKAFAACSRHALGACLLLTIGAAVVSMTACGTALSQPAGSVSIEAEVDREHVRLDEEITLTVRVIGEGLRTLPSPELPGLDGFEIVDSTSSSSVTMVNRRLSAMETRKYVLAPLQTGGFTIGPIVVRYGGERYATEPITIAVEEGKPGAPTRQRTGTLRKRPEYLPSGARSDVFVVLQADKTEAYVGEQITLTFALYRAVGLWEEPRYTPPSTSGFWVEEMPKPQPRRGVARKREYFIEEVKYALFATAPGEVTVGPATLEVVPDRFGTPVTLTTEPVELRILPLPETGVPESFMGAVGSFELSQQLSASVAEQGEPFTLRVTLSGRGNLRTVPAPPPPEAKAFKVYTSKVDEDYRFVDGVFHSKKTVEYVFIAKQPGEHAIGSVCFSYYDPADQAYHTLGTEPLVVAMQPTAAAEHQVASATSQQEIIALGEDIRFIKTGSFSGRRRHPYLYQHPAFIPAQMLPVVAIGGALLYRRYRERQQAESAALRTRRAKARSLRRLKKARKLLHRERKDEFYAELSRALSRYLEDKLHLPAAQLNKAVVAAKLMEKGLTAEEVEDIQRRREACDYVRFAPVCPAAHEMEEAYRLVEEGILALEKRLR